MEDLLQDLTRGNLAEVKIVLASVVVALAFYQVLLIAIAYGRLSLPFLAPAPASAAHRSIGDTAAVLALVIGIACLSVYGIELGDDALHSVAGLLLLAVLTLKILVVRRLHGLSRLLPGLGISVLALFVVAWLTSAAGHIGGG